MHWNAVYPNGRTKALTFSYDDGQVHDRRLVEILNRCGMKGTFHLNSGTLDTPGFLSDDEVAALFSGHEIACHGVRHEWPTQLPRERMVAEIWEDRRALERLAHYPVRGYSYAYGAYTGETVEILRALGVEYARTTESTGGFNVPADPLSLRPTAHHNGGIEALGEQFLHAPRHGRLSLFYVWGHSYEFDRDGNWGLIESFCELLGGKPDVWYCTNIEYIRYLGAVRALVSGVDGSLCHNPSGLSVWVQAGGDLIEVLPGETKEHPVKIL